MANPDNRVGHVCFSELCLIACVIATIYLTAMTSETLTTLPILSEMVTNRGRTVDQASHEDPILLVFLRHFGCTFCREALTDLAEKKAGYEGEGIRLIFVHMASHEDATEYFARYNIQDAEHVSDPMCQYYAAFGLGKGNFSQLFGLRVMIRGFDAGVLKGHGIGRQIGDGFQMPGVFLIQNGILRESFRHQYASDRPDYDELVACCVIP